MTRRSDEETWSCEAKCVRVTDKALLVELETGDEKWVPKSVVHDDSDVFDEGHEGTLVVKAWWAQKAGLS